jgi:hypothetical protein
MCKISKQEVPKNSSLKILAQLILDRLLREPMDIEEEDLYDENDEFIDEKFQSKNIYTQLMPNPEEIDKQADYWFDWIKTNIPRCIEANEIRLIIFGFSFFELLLIFMTA